MELLLFIALLLVIPFAMAAVVALLFGWIGRTRERQHLRSLDRRESALAAIATTTAPHVVGLTASAGHFVAGNAVMATDLGKGLVANLKSLIGGELRGLTPLLTRARREAYVRMLESAQGLGATAVVNVRYDTSTVVFGVPEVLCHGTALVAS